MEKYVTIPTGINDQGAPAVFQRHAPKREQHKAFARGGSNGFARAERCAPDSGDASTLILPETNLHLPSSEEFLRQSARDLSEALSAKVMLEPRSRAADASIACTKYDLGSLSVTHVRMKHLNARMSESRSVNLLIPFSGSLKVNAGRAMLNCEKQQSTAILIPARSNHIVAESEEFEGVLLSFQACDLKAAIGELAADLSEGSRSSAETILHGSGVKFVKMNYQDYNFDKIIEQLFATVQEAAKYPFFLSSSGLSGCILRAISLLIIPENVIDGVAPGHRDEEKLSKLRHIREFILENLENDISLEDVVQYSGVSARALQYAFKKAYQKTPVQWMIEQKLIAVRGRLLRPQAGTNVTFAALPYFGNLSDFARRYKEKFGEKPSTTLAKSLAQQRCSIYYER